MCLIYILIARDNFTGTCEVTTPHIYHALTMTNYRHIKLFTKLEIKALKLGIYNIKKIPPTVQLLTMI